MNLNNINGGEQGDNNIFCKFKSIWNNIKERQQLVDKIIHIGNGEYIKIKKYRKCVTREILKNNPGIIDEFYNCLFDSLYYHNANNQEQNKILSLFTDKNKFNNFFIFTHANKNRFGGGFSMYFPQETFNKNDFFNKAVNHKDFIIYLRKNLLDDYDSKFVIVLRHEVDHLVLQLLTILRQYQNHKQIYQDTFNNNFFWKKLEFFGFYNSTNYAIKKKGEGANIHWDFILNKHTGWHLNGSKEAEAYDGVINYIKDIFISRNHFYNYLLEYYGYDTNKNNRYAVINHIGQHYFNCFCNAIYVGVNSSLDDEELEIFLNYICGFKNLNSLAVFFDNFNIVDPIISKTNAYQNFINYFRKNINNI